MARALTSGMQAALTADNMRPFYLIEGYFDSGEIDLWTGIGNLSYGGKTYMGVGKILNISAFKESKTIEANGLSFTLSGLDPAIIQIALNEEYQDRPVNLYLGAFDDSWQVIASPYLHFEGRMDVMPLDEDPDAGTATVTLNVENVLADLQKAVKLNYTPEDQALFFSGDTGFSRVASLQDKEIQLAPG